MDLSGYIYDVTSGEGVPFATVSVTDYNAQTLRAGTVANDYGYFAINSPYLDDQGFLYISSTGYQPVLVDPGVFQESGDIALTRSGDLAPVVVTPGSRSNNQWLIYLLAGGGLIWMISEAGRQRRVKGVTATQARDWAKLGLQIGIPIAVLFFVIKPILQKLGLWPDARDKAQQASDKAAQNDQEAMADYRATENHTYNANTLDSIAVSLRNAVQDWYGYEWRDIARNLAYFTGMTKADARYFLGAFVKKNGYTLYQWYYQEFEDALIFTPFDYDDIYWNPGWGGTGQAYDYRGNFQKLGVTESNAGSYSWPDVVQKFIAYLYTIADVTMQ